MDISGFFNFNLQWHFNFWTFLLYLIYATFLVGGYYLISNQVKLVKKETWTNLDRFKCFVYAIFFAGGCEIIIAMMITFATSDQYAYTAPFIVIPLFYNILIITFYPLADFLYMAHSKKELARSPPHRILERYIINKFPRPFSYLVAIILYVLIFIMPPLLIIYVGGHEFIIVWISWEMIFPMGIITYYGSKGYITGLISDYNNVPRLDRSLFLGFEKSGRAFDEFKRNPVCRIMLPLRVYLYFWTIYSYYVTIIKLDPAQSSEGFNTMQYGFTVYLVLFFGVTGYFSRFWGRRTKFKTMDIMYAAFLIAAVGINVMVNFVIVNSPLLEIPFSEWVIVDIINQTNASKFALAATIEETILTLVITYYLVATRKKGFVNDTIHSLLAQSEEFFETEIPFNFVKNEDEKKRQHAYQVLRRIYDRVPVKKGYFITSPEFKDPLLDALCDPNLHSQKIAEEILGNLIEEHPDQMTGLIEEAIQSPNFDKSVNTLSVLKQRGSKILPILNIQLFYDLLNHPDFRVRESIMVILEKYYEIKKNIAKEPCKPNKKQLSQLTNRLSDPDYIVEASILRILSNCSTDVPNSIFSERLDHHVDIIRKIAANSVGSINLADLSNTAVPKLIKMLSSPNPDIQAAVMEALSKIGKFDENEIPIEPFQEGLIDQNSNVREAALKGYLKFIDEKPGQFKIDKYIERLGSEENQNIKSTLLRLIGSCFQKSFDKVLKTLIPYVKSDFNQHQKIAQKHIIEMGMKNPQVVSKVLVNQEDTESILKKGKIAQTLIIIGKESPNETIPILVESLEDENKHAKINSSSVLSELATDNANLIDLKKILELWLDEKSSKVKKNLSNVFSSIASKKTKNVKRFMPMLLNGLSEEESSVRLPISKMLYNISKNVDDVVPLTASKKMLNDSDAFIRENGLKILGNIGENFPEEAFQLILKGLNDENDFVKTAAADALTDLGRNIEDKKILSEIKDLAEEASKWTRLAALDVIIMINKKKFSFLSLEEIESYIQSDNPTFRAKATDLFETLSKNKIIEEFPLIIQILQDPEEEVRKSMISSMVRISPKFKSEEFIPKLLTYLSDETTLTLQRSIALILKRIAKYEKKSLKKRIISMLKIRVEVSQDTILSEVLSELQDEKGMSIL